MDKKYNNSRNFYNEFPTDILHKKSVWKAFDLLDYLIRKKGLNARKSIMYNVHCTLHFSKTS